MHNHDDKYPYRPGFKPGNPRLQAPVDTNESSGPADIVHYNFLNSTKVLTSLRRLCFGRVGLFVCQHHYLQLMK